MYIVWIAAVLFSLLTLLALSFGQVSTNEGWFWHVTDIHYDPTYHNRQLSCSSKVRSLGRFGDYKCDSPWLLTNSSIYAMAEIRQDVDFILWNGDTVLHAPDEELSHQTIENILDKVTNALKSAFPGKPVYATFGNHDYHPSDQFPPNNNLLYNKTLLKWKSWITDRGQDDNFRKGGYYSLKTPHGIRIVALNTNLYYVHNKQVENETDPAGQFQWLNNTLSEASRRHEKIIITTHIPPGMSNTPGRLSMYEQFHAKYVGILQLYTDSIVGIHCGHDHTDKFKLLADISGKAAVPIFIAASVSPARKHNPAIRLVKYDRKTGKHLDIEQYYLDLPYTNSGISQSWILEYRTSEVFNLTDLTADSLVGLTNLMKHKDNKEFQKAWKYRRVSLSTELQKECDHKCHVSFICEIFQLHLNGFTECVHEYMTGTATNFLNLVAFVFILLFQAVYIFS